jgi:hypothetical protein
MAVLFALLAAAAYGVSDFIGGIASRRAHALTVLLLSYPAGAVVMAALLPAYGGSVSMRTFGWSLAGGIAGLAGVALLYAGLAQAPMSCARRLAPGRSLARVPRRWQRWPSWRRARPMAAPT